MLKNNNIRDWSHIDSTPERQIKTEDYMNNRKKKQSLCFENFEVHEVKGVTFNDFYDLLIQ